MLGTLISKYARSLSDIANGSRSKKADTISRLSTDNSVASLDKCGEGGGNIHVSVFTDLKINQFQKKLIMRKRNIYEFAPPPHDYKTLATSFNTDSYLRVI